jgi:hypothetical protein
MGMSTIITGFKPPDEKWRAMKDVYDACTKAKIEVPKEVSAFFNWSKPDDAGVQVDDKTLLDLGAVALIHKGHPEGGYEIIVSRLPKDVTVVRVENCW